MRAIDTNVLVRVLVRDDPKQAQAADAYIAQGAWISHLVLAETMWVLDAVYDRSAAQIADAIESLLNHTSLSVQHEHVVSNALAQFRTRPTLGFSDCLLVEIAHSAGHTPVGTFDRNLAKLAGTHRIKP